MTRFAWLFLWIGATNGLGCSDVENPDEYNENEVITTVVLTFSPLEGGEELVYSWADRENDGDPVVDDILLEDADDYGLRVHLFNDLEDPAEDLTDEVEAKSDEHQVFFTGTAFSTGLVVHAYGDSDVNGYPVGLENTMFTEAVGSGSLIVTLRHLPPENGIAVKTGELAQGVATNGTDALPGDTDAQVEFLLRVR